mmetsp:Transcript_2992/g.7256  ORF Transcript_2992/g.7256 Transcript_2992/m.7256 type:complete len:259 (+) Transcript_2992:1147-1923(+)
MGDAEVEEDMALERFAAAVAVAVAAVAAVAVPVGVDVVAGAGPAVVTGLPNVLGEEATESESARRLPSQTFCGVLQEVLEEATKRSPDDSAENPALPLTLGALLSWQHAALPAPAALAAVGIRRMSSSTPRLSSAEQSSAAAGPGLLLWLLLLLLLMMLLLLLLAPSAFAAASSSLEGEDFFGGVVLIVVVVVVASPLFGLQLQGEQDEALPPHVPPPGLPAPGDRRGARAGGGPKASFILQEQNNCGFVSDRQSLRI